VPRRSTLWWILPVAACGTEAPPLAAVEYDDVGVDVRLNDVDTKYVVGADGVMLLDGALVTGLPTAELHAVLDCLVSGCDDYAVGAGGTVLRRTSAGGGRTVDVWTVLDLGLDRDLYDVSRIDGSIIVIGDDTLRVWNEYAGPMVGFDPAPPDVAGWGVLRDVFDYVIVGDGGRIYESPDLHEWTRVESGTTEDLLALGVLDEDPTDSLPGELWAVGSSGTVLARRTDGWRDVGVELDADLIDFSAGFVITSDRELVRLFADGTHERVARFDRVPRALQVVGYDAPVATVVGEQGMVARVAIE
jgi:hypothetical protein